MFNNKNKLNNNFNKKVIKDDIIQKKVLFENDIPFKNYEITYNKINKTLSVGCSFLDYDIKDNATNRKMELTRFDTFKLVLILIKYIFMGRI